jgi:hypothetical protein
MIIPLAAWLFDGAYFLKAVKMRLLYTRIGNYMFENQLQKLSEIIY